MDIVHTCLNVSDVDESVAFYTEQFGFEEEWSFQTADGKTVNRYVAGPNGIELQLSETEGETDLEHGNAWDHVAIKVDDVDEVFEAIDHYGIVEKPTNVPQANARTAFVEDPDGHVIELVSPNE